MNFDCSDFVNSLNSDIKTYKKIYIGTTDLDWNIIDNIEKKVNHVFNVDTYIAVGGSFLFPLANWKKRKPKNILLIDRNNTMLKIYKFFVTLIRMCNNRTDFIRTLYCRKLPTYDLNSKNMVKWLSTQHDEQMYQDLLEKFNKKMYKDQYCILKYYIFENVIKTNKNNTRQLWPTWNGRKNFKVFNRRLRVSKDSSFFASTLWYNVCGYLKSNEYYKNAKKIVEKSKIHFLNINLLQLSEMTKYINKKRNVYMFITNVDDGIAYLKTEQLCEIIKNYINKTQFNNIFYINSVLTGLHKISLYNIEYDDTKLEYEKKMFSKKKRVNVRNKFGMSFFNLEILYKRFQYKNVFDNNYLKELMNSKALVLIEKSNDGRIYKFNKNNIIYILKLIEKNINNICKEYEISSVIDELKMNKKLPDLYVNIYTIFKIKNNTQKYAIIMDKMEKNIWDLIDSTDKSILKSTIIQLLLSIFFLNHKGKIYHGDICAIRGKKGLAIHNAMYVKTEVKDLEYKLDNTTIKFNNNGYSIKLIDFGQSCYVEKYKKYLKNNKNRDKLFSLIKLSKKKFKKISYQSEVLTLIYCLLKYYRFKNIEEILQNILLKIIENNNIENVRDFDKYIIKYINNNFDSFFASFSIDWPISSYYKKSKKIKDYKIYTENFENNTKVLIINKKIANKYLIKKNYKESLIKLGKYYLYEELKRRNETFVFKKFFNLDKNGYIVVLIFKKKLIGMRTIDYINYNKGAFLHKLCIDKDFRRKGFGSKIHNTIIKFLKKKKIEYIRANVLKTNKVKQDFDKKRNVEVIGETKKHIKIIYKI